MLHPQYNRGLDWDFCLIQVESILLDGVTTGVSQFAHINLPISHPSPTIGMKNESTEYRECQVMGWGMTPDQLQSAVLLAARVEIMSHSYCVGQMRGRLDEEFQFCAGKRPTTKIFNEDSCKGDSGGPLVCKESNGQYIQYGVVSRGGRRCGDPAGRSPGVYAKVTAAIDWIKETTQIGNYCRNFILGIWTTWSISGECSASCGSGQHTYQRKCRSRSGDRDLPNTVCGTQSSTRQNWCNTHNCRKY